MKHTIYVSKAGWSRVRYAKHKAADKKSYRRSFLSHIAVHNFTTTIHTSQKIFSDEFSNIKYLYGRLIIKDLLKHFLLIIHKYFCQTFVISKHRDFLLLLPLSNLFYFKGFFFSSWLSFYVECFCFWSFSQQSLLL